jgi:hypothetical protein
MHAIILARMQTADRPVQSAKMTGREQSAVLAVKQTSQILLSSARLPAEQVWYA